MNIGQSIKTSRKKAKLSQIEFSKRIGITQTYLSQIENNIGNPSITLLEAIAKEIKIPLAIIFWNAMDDSSIVESKKDYYKRLKPIVDELIGTFFN